MNILFYNLIHVCVTIYNLKIREFLFKNLQFLCFCAPLATWKHKAIHNIIQGDTRNITIALLLICIFLNKQLKG